MSKSFDYRIAIIGAGFGGLAMAIRLRQLGITDFVILERAKDLGGTWRDNIYPGCACDVPSHLYSFSFANNPNWSSAFSKQPEILNYLKTCVKQFDLTAAIEYETTVQAMWFDAALGGWHLRLQNQKAMTAQMVVSATGPLNRPNIPALPGLASFTGTTFHSSNWPKKIDLTNKRVAVIGTGASAIQIVPEIATQVQQLSVYQRTPPWIVPRPDRKTSRLEQWFFAKMPFTQALYRHFIYWRLEMTIAGFKGNRFFQKLVENLAAWNIKKSIADPVLRQAVKPTYLPGCKRILVSSNYYPALERSNVELVTEGIETIQAKAIFSKSGTTRPIDVLVLATGFHAAGFITEVETTGLNEFDLMKTWADSGPEAYYGITVSGCPNLCFLLGPNTNLGHNSVVHMIESQVNYILDYFQKLQEPNTKYLDVKPSVQKAFNESLQSQLQHTVWQQGGCKSWYQNAQGKNTSLWPHSTVAYRRKTRQVNLSDYEVVEK